MRKSVFGIFDQVLLSYRDMVNIYSISTRDTIIVDKSGQRLLFADGLPQVFPRSSFNWLCNLSFFSQTVYSKCIVNYEKQDDSSC